MIELAAIAIVALTALCALQQGRGWAHGLRIGAAVLSLWAAWSIWQGSPVTTGAGWMTSLRGEVVIDSIGAGWLVLLTTSSVLAHLLIPARCRTADVATGGAALVVIDGGLLLSIAGCCLLTTSMVLAAAIDGHAQVARRRLGLAMLAVQALIAALWLPTTLPVLLVSAILLGIWPLTLWAEGERQGIEATGHQVPAALAALALIVRHVDLPLPALGALAVLLLLCIAAALSARQATISLLWLRSSWGTLLLAVALVDSTAATWLFAAWGSASLVAAFVHQRIDSQIPGLSLADSGGLGPILPGAYRLAVAAAMLACVSPPVLWAVERLAPLAFSAAGPIGAVAAGCLLGLPSIPLWRLTFVIFRGDTRQTTPSGGVLNKGSVWALALSILTVCAAPVGAAVLTDQPAITEALAITLAPLILLPAGVAMLWWSPRPSPDRVPSGFTTLAEDGLAAGRVADAIGAGLQAAARFSWNAVDGVIAGGIPDAAMFLLRLLSWFVARIHHRRSDWALATIVGTSLILLWSWRGGQG